MEKKETNILTEDNQNKKNDEKKVNEGQKNDERNNLILDKPEKEGEKRRNYAFSFKVLRTTRPVKVTKGGRQFSFTSLVLMKDKEKKAVAYGYGKGENAAEALKKARRKAQKKLISYFPNPPLTIPYQITVKDGATIIFLKPTPPGSGIKAGGVLDTLFRYLEIKDVSAKIIGSSNNLNVIRVAFMALDKLTGKKYEY